MSKNIRVSGVFRADLDDNGPNTLFYPLVVSLICHMVGFALIAFTPSLHFETPPERSVINVSMVSLKTTAKAPSTERQRSTPAKNAAPPKAPAKAPAKLVRKTVKTVPKQNLVPKQSLKKKTFKSTEMVKHAIRELETPEKGLADEQNAQASSPDELKAALERLRNKVGKAEAAKSATSDMDAGKNVDSGGARFGKFNEDGKRKAELIDLYRLEVAFQIQKQWAFNEALAGGDQSLVAAIVFKVMPDGEIRDIFFTDRSGNTYLDESAYKAIVKSNPVDGHPKGLNQPYVELGIRFTPQGIR